MDHVDVKPSRQPTLPEADFVHCTRADGRRWRGRHMDIYARPGTEVVYHGTSTAQVRWGGCSDPRPRLTLEQVYTVHHTEVHGSWTGVYLEGFEHLMFPSGAFHEPGAQGSWELPACAH